MVEPVYCILGATGFLGQQLLKHLAYDNVQQVRCLSRNEQVPTASIEWLTGNLHHERTLHNLIVKNSIVINLAFDAAATSGANVSAARVLGRVCVSAGAQRLVHISTATVVGRTHDDIVDESTSCVPSSSYEQTKFEIEMALLSETKGALAATVIRPVAVFGQGGQNLVKLARHVAEDHSICRRFLTYIHGMRRMNLVASENVAAAITYLAKAPLVAAQGLFIVSDDDSDNNNYAYVESRLAAAFGKVSRESKSFPFPAPMLRLLLQTLGRPNVNPHRRYSCKKLLDAGFARSVSFEAAMDDYAAFLAAQWAQHHRITG